MDAQTTSRSLAASAPRDVSAVRGLSSKWLAPIVGAFVDVVEPAIARLLMHRRWIALEIDDGDIEFHRMSGNRIVFLGRDSTLDDKVKRMLHRERSSAMELRLLPARLTRTNIKVPAGGLDYVEQIIDSRLDRLTPWNPDRVLYGFAAAPSPNVDGQYDVDIVATSREIAAGSMGRLKELGLVPSKMGSALEPITQPLRIDLFRGGNDHAGKTRRRRIASAAIVFLSIALLAYIASVAATMQSGQALVDLDQQIADARRMLIRGSGSLVDRQKAQDLIASKVPQYARFVLIDRLAAIIPDNTYLDELEFQPGSLRIAGTSTEASGLIKILQSEPTISDARFSAPVTRQDDDRDRFDITATLRQQKSQSPP